MKANEQMPLDYRLTNVVVSVAAGCRPLFSIPSMTIAYGERLLVNGPSGTGKTTLLHLLAGLLLPDRGSVLLGSWRLENLCDEDRSVCRRKHMGLVFQKLNLLEHLTACENVLLGLPTGSQGRQLAEAALERVNLGGRGQERSAGMSTGEQQRVAIARVLAASPDIILADEPTSSLDDINAEATVDALLDVAADKTLVVVSHDHRIETHFRRRVDLREFVCP